MTANKTQFRRIEQYQDRWSSYGTDPDAGISHFSEKLSVYELKKYPVFQEFDNNFLEQLSPDVSVATWRRGSVLFEEGSYIDLAFYVVRGEVAVYSESLQGAGSSSPIFHTSRAAETGRVRARKGRKSPPPRASQRK